MQQWLLARFAFQRTVGINQHNWALLDRNIFTPVLFVKVSEQPVLQSIGRYSLVFRQLLQYRDNSHEILFRA